MYKFILVIFTEFDVIIGHFKNGPAKCFMYLYITIFLQLTQVVVLYIKNCYKL